MAKNLLHCCIGTHTRVHVCYLRSVWRQLKQSLECQCMCKCVRYTGVLTSAYTSSSCVQTRCKVFKCTCVCTVCSGSLALGDEGDAGSLVGIWRVLVAWHGGLFFTEEGTGVLSVFSMF